MGHPSMRLNVVSNSPPIDLVRRKVALPPSSPRLSRYHRARSSKPGVLFCDNVYASLREKGSDDGQTVESMHFIEASQKRHLMSCSKEGIGIYNLRDTLITTERVLLTEVFGAKQRCCTQFRVWSTREQYGVKVSYC